MGCSRVLWSNCSAPSPSHRLGFPLSSRLPANTIAVSTSLRDILLDLVCVVTYYVRDHGCASARSLFLRPFRTGMGGRDHSDSSLSFPPSCSCSCMRWSTACVCVTQISSMVLSIPSETSIGVPANDWPEFGGRFLIHIPESFSNSFLIPSHPPLAARVRVDDALRKHRSQIHR